MSADSNLSKARKNKKDANFPNRSLCQGDNLDFLRVMNSESVDLIATDPPFNSGRNYFASPNSMAKGAYFPDKWAWSNEMRVQHLKELKKIHPKAHHYIEGVWQTLGDGALTSFLLFMSLRLVEMHRVLKSTGSFYLHCDYHASHYLKQLMDVVFRMDNFRNEIIWHYQAGTKGTRNFGKKHDVILFYTKGKNWNFNRQKKPVVNPDRYNKVDEDGHLYDVNGQGKRYYLKDGSTCDDVWTWIQEKEFQQINSQAKEKTGYPTQKPLALYKRIIKASSNEEDIVLDPFCGCATTLVAAENLGREWIGIDIHPQTRTITANRIAEACRLNSPDGSVIAESTLLNLEKDLDIRVFAKEDFPPRTN